MSNTVEIVFRIEGEELSIGERLPDGPLVDDVIEMTIRNMIRRALREARKMKAVYVA